MFNKATINGMSAEHRAVIFERVMDGCLHRE